MEQKIMEVLRKMQTVLEEESLRELKNVLYMVFSGCEIIQQTELQVIDDSWRIDPVSYTHLDVYKRQLQTDGRPVHSVPAQNNEETGE